MREVAIVEKNKKSTAGRPTVITDEVVNILVTSFQNGLNVREACWQAGISHEAFYERMRQKDEFTDTIERAKSSPCIKAKANIVQAIDKGNISLSKWWLEKRQSQEFGPKPSTVEEEEPKAENPFTLMSDKELYDLTVELQRSISLEGYEEDREDSPLPQLEY